MARKILLADDSVTAQNMGRKILTDAGYEVVAVNNGSAALKKIVEHKPDLIVLDVYMPGYSGLEVCQRIKENRETARIPVLLTVGKLEPFKPEEARRARADAFVVKPFEASELLTALAKLEEKIVPQPEPYKPGRFAKAIASLDEPENGTPEKFGDSDSGWKSRLRFPGRKKQAEPEEAPEIPVPARPVREFREEPLPASGAGARPASTSELERPIPAGIPRDITPEEIAAISAAAARLSGAAAPGSESEARDEIPVAHASEPAAAVAGVEAQESTLGTSNVPAAAAEPTVVGESAPMTFASAPVLREERTAEEKTAEGESSQPKIEEVKSAENGPAASDGAALQPAVPSSMETSAALVQTTPVLPELGAALSVTEIPAPILAFEQSPATTPMASEVAREVTAESAAPQPETVATSPGETQPAAPAGALPEIEVPTPVTSAPDAQSNVSPESVASLPAPEPVAAVVSIAHEAMPVQTAPAAQDEEVMAALQNLIPVAGASAIQISSDVPANLVAAVADFAQREVVPARPRWIAEEAVLTAEEAVLSLEQEMEKAYAAFAASEAARMLATSTIDSLPTIHSPSGAALTKIPAVTVPQRVEDFAAPETAFAQMTEFPAPATPASETRPVQAMAFPAADGGTPFCLPVVADAPEVVRGAQPSVDGGPLESAFPDAPPNRTPSVELGTTATDFVFAASANSDVVSKTEPDAATSQPPAPPEPEAVPADQEMTLETISAGDEEMAKNSESGLGFKMIRQSPAGNKAAAVAAPVTKENFDPAATKAEPAAMAAAASAESAPAAPPMPASAPDPRAIASIVDSVLAELRPKIVEEIAKKLAEPNK